MGSTGVLQDGVTVSNLAVPYDGSQVAPPWYDDNNLFSFGGMYSNVDDMAHWINGLLQGKVLSSESRAAMFADHIPIDPGQYYGYGFATEPAYCGPQRVVWHDGALSGIRTEDVIFPDDGIGMIFLSNNSVVNPDSFVYPIARILMPSRCP
jgi:CubicO group peptidase (beta-lactamase class C family)